MKPRYLVIVALLLLIYGVYTYNQNGRNAVHLASVITSQDNADQSITPTLNQLEAYVHNHIGASTSVFLAGSYNRALAASKLTATPPVDGSVYADAQAACAGRTSSVVQAQCVTDYVSQRLQSQAAAPATTPSKASYTYRLGSPRWAPDQAGLALLVAAAFLVAAGGLWWFGRR